MCSPAYILCSPQLAKEEKVVYDNVYACLAERHPAGPLSALAYVCSGKGFFREIESGEEESHRFDSQVPFAAHSHVVGCASSSTCSAYRRRKGWTASLTFAPSSSIRMR